MAMLWGFKTGQGYYVVTSTGVNRLATDAEKKLIDTKGGGGGYIDTVDAPALVNPHPEYPTTPPPTPGSSAEPGYVPRYGPGAPTPMSYTPEPPPPPAPGGPTYTPGISFGQGVIAGAGPDASNPNYQRQWFDLGTPGQEGVNNAYYNDPGNWGFAWDKVLNHFGGVPGGDFYKFLQNFSSTARGDYQNSVPYDKNLNVADFLDQYAPQIKGVFGLLPSAQSHGRVGGDAGRATY